MLSRKPDFAIGIDLGTTFSCVGVFENGKVKIISDEKGNRITPSCVSFTKKGVLKGESAKNRLPMEPSNTVYEVKRLMGKTFDDSTVQHDMKTWPFTVIEDGGKPKIEVKYGDVTKKLAPEEISAMILTHMKELAEKHLETYVTKAVVTVPAYFNDNQRQATENAARIAGLDILRIINEPTAAAIAYYNEGNFPSGKNILVFDIGGGTFDVSVLKFEQGSIEVAATSGDTHLGGADFDERMLEKVLSWFNDTQSKTPMPYKRQSAKLITLRNECERAKCALSERTMVEMSLEDFHEESDLLYKFSRANFEDLNQDYFETTCLLLDQALEDAKLNRDEIHEILLVGGSSRIPKLQSMIRSFFNNKRLNTSINADEAVAYGAALYAAVLNGEQGSRVKELLLLDVTPLSLGIEIKGGLMSTIIKRNTKIPASQHETYFTTEDNQTVAHIAVYQGERKIVKDNQKIGDVDLKDIPPAPAGMAKIDVSIEISTNGTIFVVALDKTTGKEVHLSIRNDKVRNTEEDVRRMIGDAWLYRKRDDQESDRVKAKNDLETYAKWMKYITKEFGTKLKVTDQKQKVASALNWVQGQQNGRIEDFKRKKVELEQAFQSVPSSYKKPGHHPEGDPLLRLRTEFQKEKNDRSGASAFGLD